MPFHAPTMHTQNVISNLFGWKNVNELCQMAQQICVKATTTMPRSFIEQIMVIAKKGPDHLVEKIYCIDMAFIRFDTKIFY